MGTRVQKFFADLAGREGFRLAGIVAASLVLTLVLVGDGSLGGWALIRAFTGPGYYQVGQYGYLTNPYGIPCGPTTPTPGVSQNNPLCVTFTPSPTLTPTSTLTPVPTTPPTVTDTPVPSGGGGGGGCTDNCGQATSIPAATDTPVPTNTAVPPGATVCTGPSCFAGTPGAVATQVSLVPPGGNVGAFLRGLQVVVTVDSSVAAKLTGGRQLTFTFDPNPDIPNDAALGALGGGIVTPVDRPIDIQAQALDVASRTSAPLPETVLRDRVTIRLPVLRQTGDPARPFAWLREFRADQKFQGYFRMDSEFDPATGSLIYHPELGEMSGTLFLPVILQPAWVQNFDSEVHVWSGPTLDAVDFGPAGPQFTTFVVVGPQVATRLYVFDPVTLNYGWIDVDGVGPSGPPAGGA